MPRRAAIAQALPLVLLALVVLVIWLPLLRRYRGDVLIIGAHACHAVAAPIGRLGIRCEAAVREGVTA